MKRKTLHGGRAASSTKPRQPNVTAISPLVNQNEDGAALPKTSIESNRDLRYVRQEGSKVNINNDINAGSNRSPQDNLVDEYICIDLLDRKICISCNEGGEVLICAESDCPVTLHAKCLCTEPKFDDKGNFHCPYCWYKRALAEAQEYRKKALLAKKDLSKFFCQNVVNSDKLPQNDAEAKRTELKEFSIVGNGSGFDNHNGQGNDNVHSQPLKTVRYQQNDMENLMASADQHGLAVEDEGKPNGQVSNTGDSRLYGEANTPVHTELAHKSRNGEKFYVHNHNISETHETGYVEGKDVIEPEDRRYNDESIVRDAKPLSAFHFGDYTDGHLPDIAFAKGAQENDEVFVDNKCTVKDREEIVQNEFKVSATDCSVSETIDSDSEPLSMTKSHVKQWIQKTDIKGKNACYKNEEVATSETLRLPRRSSLQGCGKNLTLQTGKRKRFNWTAEEENTLKEGVLMFAMEQRKIPWKKILEFGRLVFNGNRSPADLKDKWKNMRV